MTYEIYRYIFLGGAVLTGIMLAVSVLVFFILNIPNVIGDLTGANARKAIEDIRSHNETGGAQSYRTSKLNRERGTLTDKISQSGRVVANTPGYSCGPMETAKISTQGLQQDIANETTVLSGELTGENETTVLSNGDYANETTLLDAGVVSNAFVIEYEITYIHTDEVIA